jgi:hypothetical protein
MSDGWNNIVHDFYCDWKSMEICIEYWKTRYSLGPWSGFLYHNLTIPHRQGIQ